MKTLKRALAILTAAGCMAAAMPVCAIAEESEKPIPVKEFVVTGEKSGSLVVRFTGSMATYAIAKNNITSCNEMPEYGDIIEIAGYGFATELGWATNSMDFWLDEGYQTYGCNVTVTGSLFESGAEEVYTISGIDEMRGFILTNADGEEFSYENDYLTPEAQPGGFRWDYAEVGDAVTMLVYEDVPCIPQAVDTRRMAVIAENAEGNFIMMDVSNPDKNHAETYYLSLNQINQYYVGTEEIHCGDVIEFPKENVSYTEMEGTNYCSFEDGTHKIWKSGSVYEDGIREDLRVSMPYTDGWLDFDLGDRTYSMYLYNIVMGGYFQPNDVDWTALAEGDMLSMYTYGGIPCFPAEVSPADVEISGLAMVVVGVDDAENPQNYVMMSMKNAKNLASTYYLPAESVQAYLTEGTIAYGDILDITGGIVVSGGDGTSSCTFAENGTIRIAGSVFDHGTMETYTMSDRKTSFASAWVMENADGREFLSYMDFVESGEYVQPGVSLPECKPGDEVVMYTYSGIPTIPVSLNPLGDVNLDGVLDILDVIRINKYLMAGEDLPALAGLPEGDPGQCDFNGNGTIDADDSLGMMKRILHLE